MNLFTDFIRKERSAILIIIAVVIGSTILLYLPFVTNTLKYLGFPQETSMNDVYKNYDGLYYVVVSETWYRPKAIEGMRLEFLLPNEYYAAHLPLYPFAISILSLIAHPLFSMIATSVGFAAILGVLFYFVVKTLKISKNPLILTFVLLFLPRFFIIRNVGAPETLFLTLILASLFFFERKQFVMAGILGALSAMTKTPGILLFGAYGLVFLENLITTKKIDWKYLWLVLIPLGLVAVFLLYAVQYGNFFAYFNTGGVVPMPYPFSVFNSSARWVESPWLEDIVLYFMIYGFAVYKLKETKYRGFYYFSLVFLFFATFVQHRDLSRYLLPLWPLAVIAFQSLFSSKKWLYVLLIFLPAIYLYAWNFMLSNQIPVSDWRPFL